MKPGILSHSWLELSCKSVPFTQGHMCISYLPPGTLITHLTQRRLCLGAHQ